MAKFSDVYKLFDLEGENNKKSEASAPKKQKESKQVKEVDKIEVAEAIIAAPAPVCS